MGTIVVQQSPVWTAPTFGTAGLVSGQVLAANIARVCATIVNDAANDIYIGIGAPAVVGSGIRLNSGGGVLQIGGPGGIALTNQAINAISGVAAQNLTVHEAI